MESFWGILKEALNKLTMLIARQANHKHNQQVTIKPELVEGLDQSFLKHELVHHRRFKTRHQAIQEITKCIEIFYNRQRKQERLD